MTRLLTFIVLLFSWYILQAQETKSLSLDPDMQVITEHTVTIKGKKIPYSAIAGTQPVWDADGKELAYLHYVYYKRSDVKSYVIDLSIFIQWWTRIRFSLDAHQLHRTSFTQY
ncbi:MAG: hypothetical protein LC127_14795 [Chitinophagales bacterium]|nr:hypothetical protein [Chitinophagales bacterium]